MSCINVNSSGYQKPDICGNQTGLCPFFKSANDLIQKQQPSGNRAMSSLYNNLDYTFPPNLSSLSKYTMQSAQDNPVQSNTATGSNVSLLSTIADCYHINPSVVKSKSSAYDIESLNPNWTQDTMNAQVSANAPLCMSSKYPVFDVSSGSKNADTMSSMYNNLVKSCDSASDKKFWDAATVGPSDRGTGVQIQIDAYCGDVTNMKFVRCLDPGWSRVVYDATGKTPMRDSGKCTQAVPFENIAPDCGSRCCLIDNQVPPSQQCGVCSKNPIGVKKVDWSSATVTFTSVYDGTTGTIGTLGTINYCALALQLHSASNTPNPNLVLTDPNGCTAPNMTCSGLVGSSGLSNDQCQQGIGTINTNAGPNCPNVYTIRSLATSCSTSSAVLNKKPWFIGVGLNVSNIGFLTVPLGAWVACWFHWGYDPSDYTSNVCSYGAGVGATRVCILGFAENEKTGELNASRQYFEVSGTGKYTPSTWQDIWGSNATTLTPVLTNLPMHHYTESTTPTKTSTNYIHINDSAKTCQFAVPMTLDNSLDFCNGPMGFQFGFMPGYNTGTCTTLASNPCGMAEA